MITEDFVSFETAKLLKEKGFDWPESPFYSEQDRDEWRQNNSYTVPNEEYNSELPFDSETLTQVAPHVSLQMAMKWLREERGLNVYARAVWKDVEVQYGYWEEAVVGYDCFIESLSYNNYLKTNTEEPFHTYEEACESAIKYCLENLV